MAAPAPKLVKLPKCKEFVIGLEASPCGRFLATIDSQGDLAVRLQPYYSFSPTPITLIIHFYPFLSIPISP